MNNREESTAKVNMTGLMTMLFWLKISTVSYEDRYGIFVESHAARELWCYRNYLNYSDKFLVPN